MFLPPREQITSRFFVAALLRMTLRQVPRAMGGKPAPSQIFEGGHSAVEPQPKESEYLPQRRKAAKERKYRRVRSAHHFVPLT
jgi:hypothetical protein